MFYFIQINTLPNQQHLTPSHFAVDQQKPQLHHRHRVRRLLAAQQVLLPQLEHLKQEEVQVQCKNSFSKNKYFLIVNLYVNNKL